MAIEILEIHQCVVFVLLSLIHHVPGVHADIGGTLAIPSGLPGTLTTKDQEDDCSRAENAGNESMTKNAHFPILERK